MLNIISKPVSIILTTNDKPMSKNPGDVVGIISRFLEEERN